MSAETSTTTGTWRPPKSELSIRDVPQLPMGTRREFASSTPTVGHAAREAKGQRSPKQEIAGTAVGCRKVSEGRDAKSQQFGKPTARRLVALPRGSTRRTIESASRACAGVRAKNEP